MHHKISILLILLGVAALWVSPAQAIMKSNPEISQDERSVAALKVLTEIDKAMALYVKGLCCPSCAIGIRKKVSLLDFIDTERLKKGVNLDTKTQLATIAVKDKKVVDTSALAQAVRDAGYTPSHLYRLRNGELETVVIPQD
jgi:copper chaperone CopZ